MAMEWYKGSKKKPSHEKKNIRYLNACLDAGLHDELDEFCKKNGTPFFRMESSGRN